MSDLQQLHEKIAKELELAFHSEPWPGHSVVADDCHMCRIARDALLPLVSAELAERYPVYHAPTLRYHVGDLLTDGSTVTEVGWSALRNDWWINTRKDDSPHSGGPMWLMAEQVNPYLPQPNEGEKR